MHSAHAVLCGQKSVAECWQPWARTTMPRAGDAGFSYTVSTLAMISRVPFLAKATVKTRPKIAKFSIDCFP